MSNNICIDKSHNNLHADGKLLFEVIEERRQRAKKKVKEIADGDLLKQPANAIAAHIASEFTIDGLDFGKPAITGLKPEGKNYVIYQKIPFEGNPILFEYSPVAAGHRPPIGSTEKQTPARGPIGKIIKSSNSSGGGEIEIKLIIKDDVINDDDIHQKIKAKFKDNLDQIKKWAGYANEKAADFNKCLLSDVDPLIRTRKSNLKRIEEINKQLQAE